MKRTICLILVVALMACALSGCGEKKKLLGRWERSVDLSDAVRQTLQDAGVGGEYPVSDFVVTAYLEFSQDGTFHLQLDQQELTAAFENLLVQLEDHLLKMLQTQLSERQPELSMEMLLGMMSLEKEDLTRRLRQSFEENGFSQQLTADTDLSGSYLVTGKKLSFAADAEHLDKNSYIRFTIRDGQLTLSQQEGSNLFLEGNLILGPLPVQFTKIA